MFVKDFFSKNKYFLDDKKHLNVYVCGPTTYDYVHIGNVRPLITFDILNRLFSNYGKFNYVHNFTDIDDKIINRAIKEKKSEMEISNFFIKKYLEDISKLNVLLPEIMPRVSENINEIIDFIEKLIIKDFAYESNGDVYFSIEKWDKYGKINNLNLGELTEKKSSENKKYKHDFTLWKKTKKGITFDSPWSKGRPGWHTECSLFIYKYFDKNSIDIHGGGIDLVFPHHINEMAQFEALTNKKISNSWLYVGHVNFNDAKMSKSLGNIIYVKDFIKEYNSNILRMIFVLNHYTKPINISENVIFNSKNTIKKINNLLINFIINYLKENNNLLIKKIKDEEFLEILGSDLNTTNCVTHIFRKFKKIDKKNFYQIIFNLSILGFNLDLNFDFLRLKKELIEKNYQYIDEFRKRKIL